MGLPKIIKHIFILTLASVMLHLAEAFLVANLLGAFFWLSYGSLFTLVTTLFILTGSYLFLRHRNNRQTPPFGAILLIFCIVQCITVPVLLAGYMAAAIKSAGNPDTVAFSPVGEMIAGSIGLWGIALPLAVLGIIYAIEAGIKKSPSA